jgi:hypothetical protein
MMNWTRLQIGVQSGVVLMLFVRFANWLCGMNNGGWLLLVVLALGVGVSLACFTPFPQAPVLALLYMPVKINDNFK